MEPVFLIVLDRATGPEREAVHEAVKAHTSRGWWHRFVNVWIVGGGKSVAEWRDVASGALEAAAGLQEQAQSNAAILVFNLPPYDERDWAYHGHAGEERMAWLDKFL